MPLCPDSNCAPVGGVCTRGQSSVVNRAEALATGAGTGFPGVGGRERYRGRPPDGSVHAADAWYLDIEPDRRIVYAYDVRVGDTRLVASLATVELRPEGGGTRLVFTEQGVFLDGWDNPAMREEGTKGLLDALGDYLKRAV